MSSGTMGGGIVDGELLEKVLNRDARIWLLEALGISAHLVLDVRDPNVATQVTGVEAYDIDRVTSDRTNNLQDAILCIRDTRRGVSRFLIKFPVTRIRSTANKYNVWVAYEEGQVTYMKFVRMRI